jgi:nucleotide-binding universal stress UspA family protein
MSDRELIVCATRGGRGSRAVQLEAVRLARERNARLVFLYVVDVQALGEVDESLVTAVRDELEWLGRALMHVARQRAQQANIQVDVAVREGSVHDEIGHYVRESGASLLLMGAPRGTAGDTGINPFARELEEETGVQVQLVYPEAVR